MSKKNQYQLGKFYFLSLLIVTSQTSQQKCRKKNTILIRPKWANDLYRTSKTFCNFILPLFFLPFTFEFEAYPFTPAFIIILKWLLRIEWLQVTNIDGLHNNLSFKFKTCPGIFCDRLIVNLPINGSKIIWQDVPCSLSDRFVKTERGVRTRIIRDPVPAGGAHFQPFCCCLRNISTIVEKGIRPNICPLHFFLDVERILPSLCPSGEQ